MRVDLVLERWGAEAGSCTTTRGVVKGGFNLVTVIFKVLVGVVNTIL